MIYLLGAIFCSTMVFVIMRLFDRWKIDNHQSIMFNYLIATIVGSAMCDSWSSPMEIIDSDWFTMSLITGVWFVLGYLSYAVCSRKSGVAITAISSKMSVVIPVLVGVFLLREKITALHVAGIILAIMALYLSMRSGNNNSENNSSKQRVSGKLVFLPLIVFLVTGCGDVMMKFCERLNQGGNIKMMLAFIYGVSLIFTIVLVVIDLISKKTKFDYKSIFSGTALGLANYFSTLFMFKGMAIFDNVYLFPVYNVGVVAFSTVLGMLLFRERLSKANYLGLAAAIVAVILMTL